MSEEHGSIYQQDAIALLKLLPNESVDLIVTDPAYESLEKWRALGTTTRLKHSKGSSNDWFKTFPNRRFMELFEQCYRVLKKGTHLYLFCDEETRDIVCCGYSAATNTVHELSLSHRSSLVAAGFKYWKSIVWHKVVGGLGYHYRACHEFIVMAEKVEAKGKHRRLNDPRSLDVLSFKRLKGKDVYPTEKPFELIELLVSQSTQPGDTVCDPFCGSGVVGQVCEKLDRRYILGDLNTTEALRRLR